MKNFKQVHENIKKFKQETPQYETFVKDKIVYAPFIFKGNYGFMVFSQEEYSPKIESLGNYQYKHRYYYYEKFNNKNSKEVIYITFNTSSACPDKDGPTIEMCRILAEEKFNSMEIINFFSEQNPNEKDINPEDNTGNYEFIKEVLTAARKDVHIVMAWGYSKKKTYKSQIEMIGKIVTDKKFY